MTLRTWSVTSTLKYRVCYRNDFAYLVGEEYLKYFDLNDLSLDVALRCFLKRLTLTGETQECERILAHFSNHYVHCNSGVFNSEGMYVWRMQYGWRVGEGVKLKQIPREKHYEGVRFDVVCITMEVGGCKFSTKKPLTL